MQNISRIISMLRNELSEAEMLEVINDFSVDFDLETFIGDWDEDEQEAYFKKKFCNSHQDERVLDTSTVSSGSLLYLDPANRERLILSVLSRVIEDKFSEIPYENGVTQLIDGLVDIRPDQVFRSLAKSYPHLIKTYVADQIRQSDTLDELHQLNAAVLTDRLEFAEVIDHLCQLSPHGKTAVEKSFCEHATETDWYNLVVELTEDKAQFLIKSILATQSWEKLKLPTQDKKLELVRFGDWDYTLFYDGLFLLKINSITDIKDLSSRLPVITAKYAGILSFQQA